MAKTETLPGGHIRHKGRRYVTLDLFEAANRHVLEQGLVYNQLIGTLNNQGATIHRLQADKDRLTAELKAARLALAECQATQAAMRAAVYGAAEGF